MFDALVTKIAGLFEKEFLISSFIPALLFVALLCLTLGMVVGGDAAWSIMETLNGIQQAVIATIATLMLTVLAYLLNALRGSFTRFWSGRTNFPLFLFWGFQRLREAQERARYQKLRTQSQALSPWREVMAWFDGRLEPLLIPRDDVASTQEVRELHQVVQKLTPGLGPNKVALHLLLILGAYERYDEKALEPVYSAIKVRLADWHESERVRLSTLEYQLDRNYGDLNSVRPTRLGNVIESYNRYPTKRYGMEAEIFWSRLNQVMKKEDRDVLQDGQILLGFSVTMASLSLLYGTFTLLAGPWLWFEPKVWIALTIAAYGATYFLYGLAVNAAQQFGELVRGSFDLYRLELLHALRLPEPDTHSEEQATWEEFSRWTVYGKGDVEFPIRPRVAQE